MSHACSYKDTSVTCLVLHSVTCLLLQGHNSVTCLVLPGHNSVTCLVLLGHNSVTCLLLNEHHSVGPGPWHTGVTTCRPMGVYKSARRPPIALVLYTPNH